MKNTKTPALKTVFQSVAFMCGQVTAEGPAQAAQSAGVLYDNIASGLTVAKVKAFLNLK